jgi:hypothetical protein
MFKTLIGASLFLAAFAFSVRGEDQVVFSPKHTFKIVQSGTLNQDSYVWTETLFFSDNQESPVRLEYGIFWPAEFYISPDEKWILRIQKSGSGDNISYLYQVDSHHKVRRMQEELSRSGFDFLEHQPGGVPGDLYHTGLDFTSWDLKAGLLHFTIHGSGEKSGTGVDQSLTYDLAKHRITSP